MTAAYPHGCVQSLANVLATGDRPAIGAWIAEHVEDGDDGWADFARVLAAIAAAAAQQAALDAVGPGAEIIFSPGDVDTDAAAPRLAVQMMAMQANGDEPGVLGVLAAVRAADDIVGLCSALTVLAHQALNTGVLRMTDGGAS